MTKKVTVKDEDVEIVESVPEGAAKVDTDTSKDSQWDNNNRTLEEKEEASEGAPDAGMTPEEADKKLGL